MLTYRTDAMRYPVRSDFHTVVTEASISVTFKPTNSTYSFHRLTVANDLARFRPISFAGIQHAARDTEDYASDEVEEMARQIASEHARSIWLVEDKALAGTGSEPTNDIRRPRPVSLSSVPRRIASEVAATLRLIQNLEK
jgi:hypothetical protein